MPSDPSDASDSSALPRCPERFQVLALDGGGAKALFTAHVLARLEADLGVRTIDHFDLIAGTSAGGILALGLGAGLSPAEIVMHYTGLGQRVFPRSRRAPWRLGSRALGPTYSGAVLREVLNEVLGQRKLGESAKRLVIPSWDVQRAEVHIFKTPHHPRLRRDGKISMVDVAMATTAAPTFFEAAHVDGQRLVDGGVWANNPSVVAIGEAVSMLGVDLEAIRVLNIGTIDQRTNHAERLDTGGWLNWAKPAANFMITAASRGAQGTATHLVGREDFVRFDAVVPGNVFTLDRASPKALAGLAAGQSRVLSPLFTERFAEHTASPYTPNPLPSTPDASDEPGNPTTPGGAS
ncbi:patatin [Jiangella aurantiaca]|uniref:Patatin n=1 Tax=Jiangella aurantiaca TaxID=2530373 RepID=A0A4R5ADV5_9ACTN|nr:CBASS cGAMP-activated phospholipase [Jiangella aurantiaca]TDD68062.1 patatin [Jiangella aurantiaca]